MKIVSWNSQRNKVKLVMYICLKNLSISISVSLFEKKTGPADETSSQPSAAKAD